jgi:hypothetical protein
MGNNSILIALIKQSKMIQQKNYLKGCLRNPPEPTKKNLKKFYTFLIYSIIDRHLSQNNSFITSLILLRQLKEKSFVYKCVWNNH